MSARRTKPKDRRTELPDYWMRITTPEDVRAPERKGEDDFFKPDYRHWDLFSQWPSMDKSIEAVEQNLNYPIRGAIRSRIADYSEQRPFKVFDLGCGGGVSLKALKDEFGGKIRTVGLVLERTPGEAYAGVDRLIVGDVNEVTPHERYDLIYSVIGATSYTNLKTTAVGKIVSWLRPGGTAVLHMGRAKDVNEEILDEMKTQLRQNGIPEDKWDVQERKGYSFLYFKKPQRKLPG